MAARSLSNAKVFVSLIADNLSLASQRRGYAAASGASQGLVSKMGKVSKDNLGSSAEKSWVPDPVTGFYRPANQPKEIDGLAELREFFLKQKTRPSQ